MRELGQYQLGKVIGRGATAQVFGAIHTVSGQSVALKVFHPGIWSAQEQRPRLLAEFRASSLLDHPNIVKVFEPLLEGDAPAVVMELIEGQSLEEFQCRLPYVFPEISVLLIWRS